MDYKIILGEMDVLTGEICDFHNACHTLPLENKDYFLRCMFSYFKKKFEYFVEVIDTDFLEEIELEVSEEFRKKYKIELNQDQDQEQEKILISL